MYENEGILSLSAEENPGLGKPLYKVDMYQDISGKYFPKLEEKNVMYQKRRDSRVELVEFTEEGSRGRIVEDYRDRLMNR